MIFLFSSEKNIIRYRRIGYNLNFMRQSACLAFNPNMVDNYAVFFNCTPMDRASDSMIAPTYSFYINGVLLVFFFCSIFSVMLFGAQGSPSPGRLS